MDVRDILASAESDPPESSKAIPEASIATEPKLAPMPPKSQALQDHAEEQAADTPTNEAAAGDEPTHNGNQTSTRRNPGGSVSSVYSGNKMRHLKKEDGIPLWRKDIQYDFLRLVFFDQTKCFTKYSDRTTGHTFAEVYIDAMAKSSKCSKILKEKLLQDTEGAISMAMVCLLVNVGRMNTTLNFFPEMRAQLRTYHSIPALQAHQDPNAYKQLQDAPRLKSILKGATEDEPQPSTLEDIKAAPTPRTNPVNLVFVMSQFAPKMNEMHFQPPRDFFDLVMRSSLSSASRARAFLWLVWWYLESSFTYEDSQRNPFGPGQYGDGEQDSGQLPIKVPTLESLTEDQAAAENVDTEKEMDYGEVKRKERIAILASEPSPAMTALKRARKEKGLAGSGQGLYSDDEASEAGWPKAHPVSATKSSALQHETLSDYTRSPSPIAGRSFHPGIPKPVGDMRINNLLNDDAGSEASPPRPVPSSAATQPVKKGPGRGNWRRNKPKPDGSTSASARQQDDRAHHVPLLPNTGQLNFVNEAPQQLQQGLSSSFASSRNALASSQNGASLSFHPDHVPTPSYQSHKRHRGVTQHQSAVITHRKQQIDYTLDRRIRIVHVKALRKRKAEGALLRAWKRIRVMPTDYDSEEEAIKVRKAKDRAERDEDGRGTHRGKENMETAEEVDSSRRARVYMAGFARGPAEPPDVGEEARSYAQAIRRCSRRVERWQETSVPGDALIRRRQRREMLAHDGSADHDGLEVMDAPRMKVRRQRSSAAQRESLPRKRSGRAQEEQKVEPELAYEDGAGELDEEDRELLGEVDADETEDEDEDMGDD